jgi:drug/metabolite transporter (DMT)-like permease
MESKTTARVGALCGVVCPVALSLGRDGVFMLAVLGLAAFVPFLAYICSRLRSVEPDGGWLWLAAFGAGLMGMTIKLMSATPEIAYRGIPDGSQAHRALEGIANGATVVSLYPFAIFAAIVAVQSLRTAVLPRWLGGFAGVTAVGLAANGSFEHAGSVPGLLLFVVWVFVAGVALFVAETWRRPEVSPAALPRSA